MMMRRRTPRDGQQSSGGAKRYSSKGGSKTRRLVRLCILFMCLGALALGIQHLLGRVVSAKKKGDDGAGKGAASGGAVSLEEKAMMAAAWAKKFRGGRGKKAVAEEEGGEELSKQPASIEPSDADIAVTAAATAAALDMPLPPASADEVVLEEPSVTRNDDGEPFPSMFSAHDILSKDLHQMEALLEKLKPQCRYKDFVDGVIFECVEGDGCKRYMSLEAAITACDQAGNKCGGVVITGDAQYEIRKGTQVGQSPSGERTMLRQCSFDVVAPPPEFHVPEGVDVDKIGTLVDGKPTIFVSVASYRDHRCTGTVESLFERALHPQRVFVGVVEQNSYTSSYDKPCIRVKRSCAEMPYQTLCKYANQIRVHMVQAEGSLGPTFGRHRADRLYRGETYAMQVDAHSTMLKHWDDEGISQHTKTGNDMAVLTNYPSDVTAINANGLAKWQTTPMMCASHFEGEMLRFDSNPETRIPGSPVLQPFWGAGASFSKGWTNGYDLYTFHHSIIYHQYGGGPGGKRPPMFWENSGSHSNDAQRSVNRIKKLIGMDVAPGSYSEENFEKYGLGSRRPLSKYLRLFDIDFPAREQNKWQLVSTVA